MGSSNVLLSGGVMPQEKPALLNAAQQALANQLRAQQNQQQAPVPANPKKNFGGLLRNKWIKYGALGLAGLATLPIWSYPLATAWGAKKLYQNAGRIFGTARNATLSTLHGIPSLGWGGVKYLVIGSLALMLGKTMIDLDNDRGGFTDALGNNATSTSRQAIGVGADVSRVAIPIGGKVVDGAGDIASSTIHAASQCADSGEKCAENIVDGAGHLAVSGFNAWLTGWSKFFHGYYGFIGKNIPALPDLPNLPSWEGGGIENGDYSIQKQAPVTPQRKPEQRPVLSAPSPVIDQTTQAARPVANAEQPQKRSSIREDLLKGGVDVLNSRWVVACTPKVIDAQGHYLSGAAQDIENGIVAQRLANADTAVDAQMDDANSPLVRAIKANKQNNVMIKYNNGGLQVTAQKNSTFHLPDGYSCHRHDMTDFIEGHGMNPGLKTPVVPHQ